jgi:hypothetical protein
MVTSNFPKKWLIWRGMTPLTDGNMTASLRHILGLFKIVPTSLVLSQKMRNVSRDYVEKDVKSFIL